MQSLEVRIGTLEDDPCRGASVHVGAGASGRDGCLGEVEEVEDAAAVGVGAVVEVRARVRLKAVTCACGMDGRSSVWGLTSGAVDRRGDALWVLTVMGEGRRGAVVVVAVAGTGACLAGG